MSKRVTKVTKKVSFFTTTQPPGRKIEPKSINPDNMADLLFETEGLLLQLGVFTQEQCKDVMKALIYFVAYNPPSTTKNLFKEDQATGVNSFDPCAIQCIRSRNWQYVYALINRHITQYKPDWIFKNELLLLVSQKSNSMMAGSLMAGYNKGRDRPESLAALIIAYWIAKLYSVSIYRAQPSDLPDPLRHAYVLFIKWKGAQWESKMPCLPFREEDMHDGEELRSLFPFAGEYICKQPTLKRDEKSCTNSQEACLKMLGNYIGENQLVTYLALYKLSLLDFFGAIFKKRTEKGSQNSIEEVRAEMKKCVDGFNSYMRRH